jgi:hypothetical protein
MKKNSKNSKKGKKKCQIFTCSVAAKPELKPDPGVGSGAGSRSRIWSWFPEPDRDPRCGKLLDTNPNPL